MTERSFRLHFNIKRRDSVQSAKAIEIRIGNSEGTGSALKKNVCTEKKTIHTPENVTAARAALAKSPRLSARKRALSLNSSGGCLTSGFANGTIKTTGRLKSEIHARKSRNIDELKYEIQEEIAGTPLKAIHCVAEETIRRGPAPEKSEREKRRPSSGEDNLKKNKRQVRRVLRCSKLTIHFYSGFFPSSPPPPIIIIIV